MIGISRLSVFGLLLLAHGGDAEPLRLAWEWSHTQSAPTWTLTQARVTGTTIDQETLMLTTLPHERCQALAKDYTPRETWCAELPCPGVGAYTLLLQANDSPPSNALLLGITDAATCKIVSYDDAVGVVAGLRQPKPPTSPDPSRPEETAGPAPTSPPVTEAPPVTTPTAPTRPVTTPPPPPSVPPTRPVTIHPEPTPPPTAPPAQPSRPPVATGTNLVAAPTAAQPWRSGSFAGTQSQTTLDASTQRDGQATQQITGSGPYYGTSTSTNFPVTAGQTYEVSAWVKTQDITDFVELDVFYWGAKGETLSRWGEAVGGRLKGTQEWTPLTGQITIPPKAVRAVIQLRVKSTGGTAWVDAVAMRAQTQAGVGTSAPPREVEVTPAQSPAPPKPEAPTLLPPPAPAQTRQALRAQYDVLKRDYQAALTTIKTAYATTLKALQAHWTPQAQQQEAQAREAGNAQMQALYQALLEARKPLDAQWKEAR